MKTESGTVANFRVNFRDALACDGRSLSAFARDIKTSVSYLSRIRSGSQYTDTGAPIVPGLDTCERIASGLGYHIIDMLRSVPEFRALLKAKYPDFRPPTTPETRGRPAPAVPKLRRPRKAKSPRKKSPAA